MSLKKLRSFFSNTITLFLLIVLLGTFLRFNDLATIPPTLNWDEVSFAYNAHSIIETGKDEFGKSYPLYFRGLDDYKLPGYMYAAVVSEMIFGYNSFAVRFPSAFFGSLTIIVIFFLARFLVSNKNIALLSALLFVILPWHIPYSRMAAEVTIGMFLFFAGLLFFLYGTKKDTRYFLLSFVFFALSQYTYLSFRYLVFLLVPVLFVVYRKVLFKQRKMIYVFGILFLLFTVLIGYDSYINRDTSRTSGLAAVTPYTDQYLQDISRLQYDGTLGINIPRRIFHDSHIFSTVDILTHNYLRAFAPDFLFYDNGQERHYTPGLGLLYLWMLPFIILGFFVLPRLRRDAAFVIAALVLLTPLAPAFAFDSPNAIRVIPLAVPFSLLCALGIFYLGSKLSKHRRYFYCYVGVVVFLISFFLYHFYHQYTIHLPHERSHEWQYGRKEMTEFILEHQKEYQQIIVSTTLRWPNVFFLYYANYDPHKYLAQGGTRSGSWSAENNTIENIAFHKFSYPTKKGKIKTLLIGKPTDFPETVKPREIIRYRNGDPAIYLVDVFL